MSDSEKYLLLNLEDEQSKKTAEAIANKSARKILDYLSSKEEAGAEEISRNLNLPISTIDYNLKNLKKAGLIEAKHFLWSNRGKKIVQYRVAKKFIVIAPKGLSWKDEIKKILPFIGISAVLAGAIEYLTKPQPILMAVQKSVSDESGQLFASAPSMAQESLIQNPHYGLWFFTFVLIILGIYLLIKFIKRKQ